MGNHYKLFLKKHCRVLVIVLKKIEKLKRSLETIGMARYWERIRWIF